MNRMDTKLNDPLTEQIIGLAMKVHRVLGPGFLESVYRKALLFEMRKAGLRAEEEKRINVLYEEVLVGDFAADILVEDLDRLRAILGQLALKHRTTLMIGRTHGVHAEPTTFGLKAAGWYAEAGRHRERLLRARAGIGAGKLSGAVGTFAHVPPFVEEYVCRRLGLAADPASTQVVARDRHAEFMAVLAGIAASVAYRVVQRHAMRAWEEGTDFKALLLADPEVTRYLAPADIENCFDLGYHLRHLDTIYARVGLASDARPS